MVDTVKQRIDDSKKQVIEQLTKMPIIQVAVERARVARSTFYRWLVSDKKFKAEVNKAITISKDIVSDVAESQLINNIKNGNMTAIIYWLKNHKDQYREYSGLSVKEQNILINQLSKTNTQMYKLLTELVLKKKLPVKTANYLKNISKQMNDSKENDIEKAKLKLFNKILKD
jgi:uncharacterized membrane protein YgaE (UPF0421/DUF939 family)